MPPGRKKPKGKIKLVVNKPVKVKKPKANSKPDKKRGKA